MNFINCIITLCNLYGIYPIYYSRGLCKIWMIILVIMSCITHVTNIKYKLYGMHPINIYLHEILLLDRIISCSPIIYILFDRNIALSVFSNSIFTLGLICLTISETFHSYEIYTLSRSLWNICIYHVLYLQFTGNLQ